jgi:non-homologous end joining protein Ku
VAEPSRVINLMDALKRSVAAERSTPARAGPERRRTAKQPAVRSVKKRLRRAG